ncbi:MAG: hypothetical protein MZU97_26170 [Bacillus subtilis]|nr:hypothetical protein [Bacillus subtilis]
MAKIVTLGEIMLRLSTPLQSRIVQSDCFDVVYGGGEANVARQLGQLWPPSVFRLESPGA